MKLTADVIEIWKREGVQPHQRAQIFPQEWVDLCDLALKGCAQSERTAWTPMRDAPPINQDCRKICWIETKDGMVYIGLKAWDFQRGCWLTNGEPMLETERVTHWMSLPERP